MKAKLCSSKVYNERTAKSSALQRGSVWEGCVLSTNHLESTRDFSPIPMTTSVHHDVPTLTPDGCRNDAGDRVAFTRSSIEPLQAFEFDNESRGLRFMTWLLLVEKDEEDSSHQTLTSDPTLFTSPMRCLSVIDILISISLSSLSWFDEGHRIACRRLFDMDRDDGSIECCY